MLIFSIKIQLWFKFINSIMLLIGLCYIYILLFYYALMNLCEFIDIILVYYY